MTCGWQGNFIKRKKLGNEGMEKGNKERVSLSINEEDVKKIKSFGHWGKPLVCKNAFNIQSGFELGVSVYDTNDFPKPKIHEDEEAIYIIEGEGYARIGDKEVRLRQGTAIYIPPKTPHCIKRIGKEKLKAVYCHSGRTKEL